MTVTSDALCDECGHARTVSRGRNVDHETRMCDLKCAPCGRVTRHAIAARSNTQHEPAREHLVALMRSQGWTVLEMDSLQRVITRINPSAKTVWIRAGESPDQVRRIAKLMLLKDVI